MPAWQQPGMMGGGFLEEDPAPFGAEMQHSGVPLFQDGMDFRTQGDDAPTRVARPIAQQMVNKRTTVGRSASPYRAARRALLAGGPRRAAGCGRRRRPRRAAAAAAWLSVRRRRLCRSAAI